MKRLKKNLSLLLSLLLLLAALLPAEARAAEPPAGEEPAEQQWTEPTQAPESTQAPENVGEAERSERLAEPDDEAEQLDETEELLAEQPVEVFAPGGENEERALLNAFAEQKLNALHSRPGMLLRAARDPAASLTGVNRTVYEKLKIQIAAVADGERGSTRFVIPVTELGLEKTSWTAAELGLESLVTGSTFSQEAMAAVNARVGFTLRAVVSCLQSACPYELYWYDKTVGTALESYSFAGNTTTIRVTGSMTFTFAVIQSYADGNSVNVGGKLYLCGVNGSYGARVNAAVANAGQIVAQLSGASDLEKLKGYKNAICAAVSYDSAALSDSAAYGDPWQLISVFDNDPSTNVVCEGYAKAFQYLCDQTSFQGDVTAYSVTGVMSGGTGAGSHMWNLVRMEDGGVYLADITNCDDGAVGAPELLFLAGCESGSVKNGYVFRAGNRSLSYYYDDKTTAVFSEGELTLSSAAYTPTPSVPENASFVSANTVTFKGELKLNFYLRLSSALLNDTGAYVTITAKGTETKIPLSQARTNGEYRIFSLPVVAKEMREAATLRLYTGVGTAAPLCLAERDITAAGYTTSVMDYLEKAQQTSSNPKMVALAKAAADYGTAAQIYFKYKAEGLAIAPAVAAVSASQLAGFAPQYLSGKPSGITLHSASVMFKSDNALRQYFTLADGQNVSNYSFTVDGGGMSPVLSSQNRYYVALPNIAAKDLDTEHAYLVTCGSESYSFRYSPMSYAYQILQRSQDTDMINLAKALYLYNQAANDYFE